MLRGLFDPLVRAYFKNKFGGSGGEADKTLVGYNYGMTLPDINTVWTDELKEKYPYVFINVIAQNTALYMCTSKWFLFDNVSSVRCQESGESVISHYDCTNRCWGEPFVQKYDAEEEIVGEILWANFVLESADRPEINRQTSAVPVYESEALTTADGYELQDINGLYLVPKESE